MAAKGTTKGPNAIRRAYLKISNMVRSLMGIRYSDINRLYDEIDAGVFKSKNLNKDGIKEFNERYGKK